MADIVESSVRSKMMSGIRGKDTRPELVMRKGLHARGFRYVLRGRGLPGKPDLVFPRYNALILVHGCFWHVHNCSDFKWPKTRRNFWRRKLLGNRRRDVMTVSRLRKEGWRVLVVWECALKGSKLQFLHSILDTVEIWLRSDVEYMEIMDEEKILA